MVRFYLCNKSSINKFFIPYDGKGSYNFAMTRWISLIIGVLWVVLLARLWFLADDSSQDDSYNTIAIKVLDWGKTNKIKDLQEKNESDQKVIESIVDTIDMLQEQIEEEQRKADPINWKINRRERCILILSGSLGTLEDPDCEQTMRDGSFR